MSNSTKRVIYPVKFFTGILLKDLALKDRIEEILSEHWGEIEQITPIRDFVETDYYESEMGKELQRYWIFFKNLINKEQLASIKNITNKIEEKFSINNQRVVNIDPGYITPAKVILASTKNYTHRIYIGENIFAEVTLYFKNKRFQTWPWTYPDYKTENAIELFTKIRNRYVKEVL